MKKLYFVRHGESEANKNKLFAGAWDTPLTDLGKDQAEKAGEQAKKIKIDSIVSSALSRAVETAQIIANAIGYPLDSIVESSLFNERNYGQLQQKSYSHADGIDFELIPGVETTEQLLDRGAKAVKFLGSLDADSILVVGHGTFGRVLRDQLLKQSTEVEVPIEEEIPNAEIVEWL